MKVKGLQNQILPVEVLIGFDQDAPTTTISTLKVFLVEVSELKLLHSTSPAFTMIMYAEIIPLSFKKVEPLVVHI